MAALFLIAVGLDPGGVPVGAAGVSARRGKRTARGFRIYAEIPDSRGNVLRVQESSAVGDERSAAFLWLFVDETAANKARREEWEQRMGKRSDHAPHLSVEAVRALQEALEEFLQDVEP